MSQAKTENASPNLPEYSVSELSSALKRTVEDTFAYVRVRGEISGLARPRSGHVYFALKDDKSVMDAVCWRGTASRFTFKPEDGLEVICTGKLTTYAARSKYQIVVERMEPAGIGALLAQLEARRKQLAGEGLFDEARKQPLPTLPRVIGVVTSPTGAVIRDILHRLRDRFPCHVLVWPVLVQGQGAAEQVAAAIEGFNNLPEDGALPRPDLLIVARGGGSIEDLWAFNEEIVVRAAAASAIPLISAVGHETDNTLIDFASDRRAPTPTAAAEIAVPVRADLLSRTRELGSRNDAAGARLLAERHNVLRGLVRGLRGPADMLRQAEQRLDDSAGRLERGLLAWAGTRRAALQTLAAVLRPQLLRGKIDRHRDGLRHGAEGLEGAIGRRLQDTEKRLASQGHLLESLSFRRVLARGYSLVRDAAGVPITLAGATVGGQNINIEFGDGNIAAVIGDGSVAPQGKKAPTKRSATKRPAAKSPAFKKTGGGGGDDDPQGSLL